MKQLRKAVVFASMMILACAAGAWGYPVNTGDIIYVGDGLGSTAGGEFIISTQQGGPLFTTFCVELDEYLDFSNGFRVDSISDTATRGGVNTNAGDPLSGATKWLFYEFSTLNLHTDISAWNNNTAGADALQLAIWKLEDELVGGTYYSDLYLAQYNNNALAQALVAAAGNHADFSDDVKVMNLTYLNGNVAQSLLIAEKSRIVPPVPEPSTLLLTGLGLVGVAYLRRKRKG